MTTILKLGGSIITDKSRERTLDEASLESIVAPLGETSTADYLIVLGGGSFGHPAAKRHGVTATEGTDDPQAVAEIHDAMLELTALVVDRLIWAGIPAMSFHPLSMARRHGDLEMAFEAVEAAMEEGFVPVIHGDGVVTVGDGVTILSGDEIVAEAATHLEADRVGLCSNVPGVLDDDGTVIDRIETFEAVAESLGGSDEVDVTGGMAAKVSTLLDVGVQASIFDISALAAFLEGGQPGTTIDPTG